MSDISANWNENLPSDTSIAVRGRQEIINFWQATAQGLEQNVEFPGGNLKLGASKSFYGTSSAVSYATADRKAFKERLMVASDVTRVVAFDDEISQDTHIIGSSAAMYSYHTAFVGNDISYWISISGQTLVGSGVASGTLFYTYSGQEATGANKNRNGQFASPPTIILNSSNTNESFVVTSIDTFTFAWAKHSIDAASAASMYWHVHGHQDIHRTTGSAIFEML